MGVLGVSSRPGRRRCAHLVVQRGVVAVSILVVAWVTVPVHQRVCLALLNAAVCCHLTTAGLSATAVQMDDTHKCFSS